MNILAPSAAPFPIDKHLNTAAANITAAQKKELAATHNELQSLNLLSSKFAAPKMNQPHSLDAEITATEAALAAEPSEELALDLHGLILRKSQSELTAPTITASIGRKVRETIDTLQPIALSIIDNAEAAFLVEAEQHREASKLTTSFSAPTADFDARVNSSIAAFEKKRKWIQTDNSAAHFLIAELGLAV
jgi:hypothetical protein